MALDLQSLFDEAKCFVCFGATEEDSLEIALLARISVKVVPGGNFLTTQINEPLLTESGDNLVWQ